MATGDDTITVVLHPQDHRLMNVPSTMEKSFWTGVSLASLMLCSRSETDGTHWQRLCNKPDRVPVMVGIFLVPIFNACEPFYQS